MLSRLAESFFWIGRYLERTEGTTRLLAEHHQLLVEDTRVPADDGCRVLLEALGLGDGTVVSTPHGLVRAVLGSPDDPGTVAGAATAARENARAIRDALSGEVFEALNGVHLRLTAATASDIEPASPGVLLYGVLERLAVVAGVLDWTSPRDEGYVFLRLGRALERIDITARLLAVRHDRLWPESGPATLLRSAGGLHAFLRGRHPLGGDEARAFLVLDPAFPRSMLGCATVAEAAVRELEQLGSVAQGGGILRTVGLLRSELEFVAAWSAPPKPAPRCPCRSSARSERWCGVNDHHGWTQGDERMSTLSWRVRVDHRTGLRYSSPVSVSFNEARMTPADDNGQLLIHHELEVEPSARVQQYVDYWGTVVEAFDVHSPHTSLDVISRNVVDIPAARPRPPDLAWDDVLTGKVFDAWCEFLRPSQYVDNAADDPARQALVEELRALPSPREAADAAIAAVRVHLIYEPGSTSVSTTASQAWRSRTGVCQDFSHATLSLLRAVGIPARYVSGYLYSEPDGQIGETVTGESHAWIEAWDGSWWAADPTNGMDVGSDHIVVARGRDYADVSPLKGIYAGGTSEDIAVSVTLTRLDR